LKNSAQQLTVTYQTIVENKRPNLSGFRLGKLKKPQNCQEILNYLQNPMKKEEMTIGADSTAAVFRRNVTYTSQKELEQSVAPLILPFCQRF